jgi:hypothetical protein
LDDRARGTPRALEARMTKTRTWIPIFALLLAACALEDEIDVGEASAEVITLTPISPIFLRPAITGISPLSGAPGTTVTISGRGFDTLFAGPAAFGSTTLSGARASITYVSSTTLRAVVPAGARPGPIYILSNFSVVGGQPTVQLTSSQIFTPIVVPAAPSVLTATAVSDTEIRLSWIDNSWNETGFEISERCGAAAAWTSLGSVSANQTSEPITGLAPGTSCSYRVRATATATAPSAWSNFATATTLVNFIDVTIASATPASPLRPWSNGQSFFAGTGGGAYFDANADGVVAGASGNGAYPLWPQATQANPNVLPVLTLNEGRLFDALNGLRANLIVFTTIPGTGGAVPGFPQFVAVHLRLTTDLQGNITAVTPISALGGDFLVGEGRMMVAAGTTVTIGGNVNGRVSGAVQATLFQNEPYFDTWGVLQFEQHITELVVDFDVPVSAK